MTRRVLNDLGPLDEAYFNHNEDIDHCLRAVELGYKNFVCGNSLAYHWQSQSGWARFARVMPAEIMFWSRWAGRYEIDLGRFVDEALDHVLDQAPELESFGFHVLDLSRGADQEFVLDRVLARWPDIQPRVRDHRQMNNPSLRLWLPLLLPHWVLLEPVPFIYLVDRYRELEENHLWFETRKRMVVDELVVDLFGNVVRTSELALTRD